MSSDVSAATWRICLRDRGQPEVLAAGPRSAWANPGVSVEPERRHSDGHIARACSLPRAAAPDVPRPRRTGPGAAARGLEQPNTGCPRVDWETGRSGDYPLEAPPSQ